MDNDAVNINIYSFSQGYIKNISGHTHTFALSPKTVLYCNLGAHLITRNAIRTPLVDNLLHDNLTRGVLPAINIMFGVPLRLCPRWP